MTHKKPLFWFLILTLFISVAVVALMYLRQIRESDKGAAIPVITVDTEGEESRPKIGEPDESVVLREESTLPRPSESPAPTTDVAKKTEEDGEMKLQLAYCAAALRGKTSKIREEGLKNLKTQYLITSVALKAGDSEIKEAAFKRIQSQHCLSYFALKTEDSQQAKKALSRVTDLVCLAMVATETQDSLLALSALARIDNRQYIEFVAVKAKDSRIRDAAMRKLSDSKPTLNNNLSLMRL